MWRQLKRDSRVLLDFKSSSFSRNITDRYHAGYTCLTRLPWNSRLRKTTAKGGWTMDKGKIRVSHSTAAKIYDKYNVWNRPNIYGCYSLTAATIVCQSLRIGSLQRLGLKSRGEYFQNTQKVYILPYSFRNGLIFDIWYLFSICNAWQTARKGRIDDLILRACFDSREVIYMFDV